MRFLNEELRSRLRRDKVPGNSGVFENVPIAMGSVTMNAQTKTITPTDPRGATVKLLSTDLFCAFPATKDTGAVTAVEATAYVDANNFTIKVTVAPVGNNGVVNWVIFRPTAPV